MEIQKVKLEDLERLNEISYASKAYWKYPSEWLEQWKDDLTISEDFVLNHSVFKMLVEGEIVGFFVIIKEVDFATIEHLWIHPDYIGKGYGKALLKYGFENCIPKGMQVQVLSDPNAEAFYQRQGFETFEKKPTAQAGRFLPRMKKINL